MRRNQNSSSRADPAAAVDVAAAAHQQLTKFLDSFADNSNDSDPDTKTDEEEDGNESSGWRVQADRSSCAPASNLSAPAISIFEDSLKKQCGYVAFETCCMRRRVVANMCRLSADELLCAVCLGEQRDYSLLFRYASPEQLFVVSV